MEGGWERKECFVVHQKFMEELKVAEMGLSREDGHVRGEKELALSGKCERGREGREVKGVRERGGGRE